MGNCTKDKVLSFDRAVPRYTSYPTSPHFHEGFSDADYRAWLAQLPSDDAISFYVHVPFCQRLCWFCGCHTKITLRESPVIDYADYLVREIDLLACALQTRPAIKHLHFGGGSPTILPLNSYRRVMDTISEVFPFTKGAEIAVEIDPRNFTEGMAATYAKSGVNRVSFGVQDFDDTVMKAVNRPQPYGVVYRSIDLAREYGINNINIDLMYGLPYQTIETMEKLADNVLTLAPDRIALFGYAHVPWMKKHMRLIPDEALPDISLRYDLFEVMARRLEAAGYEAIGIDHFAKKNDALAVAARGGTLRRNFQGYTADAAKSLLAIGASAIGQLPQGYVQNTIHVPQYRDRIDAGKLPVEKSRVLTDDDRLRARIIEHLMSAAHVDLDAVCGTAKAAEFTPAIEELRKFELAGLLDIKGNSITVKNRFAVRLACAAFDSYLRPVSETGQRHVTAI
ncbi:MAG: oxygen-independent coproporphyrinogen III oxidase [Alphaproteobacteria bacterium]|nr:oxygen-independent coproporphyrinogen III oxidase [Alphaproteobacteria bacterium]